MSRWIKFFVINVFAIIKAPSFRAITKSTLSRKPRRKETKHRKDWAVSKIVPTLAAGSGVVTTRAQVDFVVTEFGVAKLKGLSLRERAEVLISIAHPDFRDGLISKWIG